MSENSLKARSFGIAEIAGTALIVPAVLVLLALLSYQDASGVTGEAVTNLIGAGGHVTAELLLYLFGGASYLIPPYAIAVGAYCLIRSDVPDLLLRAIALFILVIAGAVLIYLFEGIDETLFWSGGGVMGRRLGDALETIVGHFGATLLALGALVPGLMLGSPYSLPEMGRRFVLPIFTGAGRSVVFSMETVQKMRQRPKRVKPGSADPRDQAGPIEQDEPSRARDGEVAPENPGRTKTNFTKEKETSHMETNSQESASRQESNHADHMPFFERVNAARKPWFERVGAEEAPEPAVPGKRRGQLERLSPTYGKQVALDNGFLLSTRARHVRSLLKGLAADGEEAAAPESEGGEARRSTEEKRRPAPRPPASSRGFTRRQNPTPRQTRAGDERSRTAAASTSGDDYDGYFSDGDSRFHFRSLDLNDRGPRARATQTVDAPETRTVQPEPTARPQAETLLRPINLKILERENPAPDADMPRGVEPPAEEMEAIQPQARGIAPGARTLEALQSFSEAAREPAADGALALAADESRPYRTTLVENFETADVDAPLADEVEDRDVAGPDTDFLAMESAVEEALEAAPGVAPAVAPAVDPAVESIENEIAGIDPAEFAVDPDMSAEAAAPEPMQYQRPLRKEQKEAPPFPELPAVEVIRPDYYIPRDILRMPNRLPPEDIKGEIELTCKRLEKTLHDFGIKAEIVRTQRGPIITLYEIRPEAGIKVSRIMNIVDEIKMNLEARSVRIIAPIPGKNTVGIEIPNRRREEVTLGELVRHDPQFFGKSRELSLAMGKDISGENGYVDLTRLPHLLIAGATGAGKSVYMNTIIASLLYTRSPQELRFIMIDPKMVELTLFEGIPHLLMPVITDVKRASKALNWAVGEMERRYAFLSHMKCRDIRSYNQKFSRGGARGSVSTPDAHMPYLVIFIDELSDLMIMAPKDVEDSIIRLTQKARAVGIHIVMATQRPSVDVITALIKANCPARIAFQVAQKTDSRVILDSNGAETLLGRGDMLYKTPSATGLGRIQTPLIEENEIERIVQETRRFGRPSYIEMPGGSESDEEFGTESEDVDRGLFDEAWRIVQETGKTSTSYIQRRLRIGYNRAARIIEMLEEKGYLGPQIGNRPREILKKD